VLDNKLPLYINLQFHSFNFLISNSQIFWYFHSTMASRRLLSRQLSILSGSRGASCVAASSIHRLGQASRSLHSSPRVLQAAAAARAPSDPKAFEKHHRKIENPRDATNFIDNEFVPSKAENWFSINDPSTNNLVSRAPQSTQEELKAAVESAQKAFPKWKATSLLARQQIMFKFVNLIRLHWDRLAASITVEQGKTFEDAKGDVLRGLQVAETACGITTQLTGEVLDVAKDMETRTYREPLGVVAGICPFST
jgi:malonate-semialdehyde dehydrogenase (acetylating) / methylmalonate-semialdehyde dehydrogenase